MSGVCNDGEGRWYGVVVRVMIENNWMVVCGSNSVATYA